MQRLPSAKPHRLTSRYGDIHRAIRLRANARRGHDIAIASLTGGRKLREWLKRDSAESFYR